MDYGLIEGQHRATVAGAYHIGEVAELAEGTTLLTWQSLIALEGSNPSLSASST